MNNKEANYYSVVGGYRGAFKNAKDQWIGVDHWKYFQYMKPSPVKRWQGPPNKAILDAMKSPTYRHYELSPKELREQVTKKKINSFLDSILSPRSYSAKSGEWSDRPGFSRHKRLSTARGKEVNKTYLGYKIYTSDDAWKTDLDSDSDFDTEQDVKEFIRAWNKKRKYNPNMLEELRAKFARNPIKSGGQFRLAEAVAHGYQTGTRMSKKVAEELLKKTPKEVRMRFARGNPEDNLYLWGYHRIRGWKKLKGPSDVDTLTQYESYFAREELKDFFANVPFSGFENDTRKTYTKFIISKREPKIKGNSGLEEVDATQLAEGFHGRSVLDEIDIVENEHYPAQQAIIGMLEELQIVSEDGIYCTPINFKHHDHRSAFAKNGKESDTVYVTFPNRNQIEFIGGDQKLPVEEDKAMVQIGPVFSIAYWTDKHHLSDGTGFSSYIHHFGEESVKMNNDKPVPSKLRERIKFLPLLVYNTRNEKLMLVGGSYSVRDEGVTN